MTFLSKTHLLLLLIFILAFVLRVVAAYHTHVSTDEMFYSIIPLNIINAERLGTVIQSHLYFYLADLGYQLFGGITAVSIRLLSVVFGALTVFVIYVLSMEFFKNRNVSLAASFLFAISGYVLQYNYEADMPAFFFSLVSIYYFIRALKENLHYLYLSSLFLALAVLIKTIVIFFIPAYLIVFVWYGVKEKKLVMTINDNYVINQNTVRTFIIAILIGLVVLSPVFIYNYFLYQETGMTDFYFSSLGFGKNLYERMENKPWELKRFGVVTLDKAGEWLRVDAVIFLFGIIGIFLSWRKNKYIAALLLLSIIFLFGYIAGVTGSSSHFLWIPLILSIFAAYALFYSAALLKKWLHFNYFIPLIIITTIIISIFTISNIVKQREKSITLLMRNYVHTEIPDDAIVVMDSRIYYGINAWVFNDRHYVSDQYFLNLARAPPGEITGEIIKIPLYYIECGPGTRCGWKKEDFDNIAPISEAIASSFKQNMQKAATVTGVESFNVYTTTIEIPSGLFELIDTSHVLWSYPIGWKYPELAPDNYHVSGILKLLENIGFLILYVDVLLALLSIPALFYLVFRKYEMA